MKEVYSIKRPVHEYSWSGLLFVICKLSFRAATNGFRVAGQFFQHRQSFDIVGQSAHGFARSGNDRRAFQKRIDADAVSETRRRASRQSVRRAGDVIAQRHRRIEENRARVPDMSTHVQRVAAPNLDVFGCGHIA